MFPNLFPRNQESHKEIFVLDFSDYERGKEYLEALLSLLEINWFQLKAVGEL